MRIDLTSAETDLVKSVIEAFQKRQLKLGFAESCTGGLLSSLFTAQPGVSEIFMGSLVCYSNDSKMRLLHVRAETLQKYGAVSPEAALEMAEGALNALQVNCAVSITGIAGPTGATEKKPLGMVCFGFTRNFSNDGLNPAQVVSFVKTEHFVGSRQSIQLQSSLYAVRTLQSMIS